MKELTNKEMMNIYGGGINLGLAALIIGSVTFVIGIFDGITRPFKCR